MGDKLFKKISFYSSRLFYFVLVRGTLSGTPSWENLGRGVRGNGLSIVFLEGLFALLAGRGCMLSPLKIPLKFTALPGKIAVGNGKVADEEKKGGGSRGKWVHGKGNDNRQEKKTNGIIKEDAKKKKTAHAYLIQERGTRPNVLSVCSRNRVGGKHSYTGEF